MYYSHFLLVPKAALFRRLKRICFPSDIFILFMLSLEFVAIFSSVQVPELLPLLLLRVGIILGRTLRTASVGTLSSSDYF
jgi:hypothetical protein